MEALGFKPLDALCDSIEASQGNAYSIFVDDVVVACFGCAGNGSERGFVWLLGGVGLEEVGSWFLRRSPIWLERISWGCAEVGNLVDLRNRVSIRWLEWLGFEFGKEHERGGHRFVEFWKHV